MKNFLVKLVMKNWPIRLRFWLIAAVLFFARESIFLMAQRFEAGDPSFLVAKGIMLIIGTLIVPLCLYPVFAISAAFMRSSIYSIKDEMKESSNGVVYNEKGRIVLNHVVLKDS